MENFRLYIEKTFQFFLVEMNLWGFTFTFLDMFILGAIFAVLGYVLYSIFDL